MNFENAFARLASRTARLAGSASTFALCVLVVAIWAATGPAFHFSQTWQLVINTGTTIVTFLMVFLIQNTQNRDSLALQTKLDELILTSNAADEFVGIERLTDQELQALHARRLAAAAAHGRLARQAQEEISTRRGASAEGCSSVWPLVGASRPSRPDHAANDRDVRRSPR